MLLVCKLDLQVKFFFPYKMLNVEGRLYKTFVWKLLGFSDIDCINCLDEPTKKP